MNINMEIKLINKNDEKTVKIGPCWPFLLVGFFVTLFRRDYANFLVGLISELILLALIRHFTLAGIVSFVIWRIYWFLSYNKIYIMDLVDNGYIGKGKKDKERLEKYLGLEKNK